jgi:hypothetical protein
VHDDNELGNDQVNDSSAEFADGDYGYDLAHEATDGAPQTADEHRPQHPRFPAPPDDRGGDYGYDEAHDM